MEIDHKLILRCQNNDRAAFDTLFEKYEAYLYRICLGIVSNREEALDVMQEVFIKIYRSIGEFERGRPFLPWLRRIAVNTALNFVRTRERQQSAGPVLLSEAGEAVNLTNCLPAPDNTEEAALLGDFQDTLEKALEELPVQYRSALLLRYLDDLSYDEIANTLGQPLGTVKNSIFRARRLLKTKLQSCGYLEV